MDAGQRFETFGDGGAGSRTVKDTGAARPSDSAGTVVSGRTGRLSRALEASAPERVGRFLVVRQLGAGAMGRVFLAYDPELDRKLAIKLVRADMAARSLREAHALARLSHPNVVQVYETGEHHGLAFIAMEYVPGQTLGQWLGAPHDWREVLEMFLQAGRGLAAAHAAGIVHRDFKPANVLVGADGRARVADFGLARAAEGEPGDGPGASGLAFAIELTRGGGLLGTPAYMAPEQLTSRRSSPHSDQFNFCVALFEGLYGARPFTGKTIEDLVHAVTTTPPRSRPSWTRVPRRLHEVILRGLRVDPSQRWTDMEALLAALVRAADRRRTEWLLTIGASAVASALVVARAAGLGVAPTDHAGAEQLHAVWSEARREQLRAAFAATGLEYAASAADTAVAALDRYAATWLIARRGAVEASWSRRGRPAEGAAAVDVTLHCLAGRLRELEAAVVSLSEFADPRTVERAGQATGRLSSIEACAREDSASAAPRPAELELAVRVEALRGGLAQIEAALRAGQIERARVLAESMRGQVIAAGYAPLHAEFDLMVGRIAVERGEHEAAAAALRDAHQAAFTSGHDRVALRAALELIMVEGAHRSDAGAGQRWVDVARAWVERVGTAGDRAGFFNHLGVFHRRHDRYADALAAFERAVELRAALADGDPLELAIVRNNVAMTLSALGRYAEAAEQHAQVLELRRARLGERHPLVASTLNNLGNALHDLGRFDEAAERLRAALELRVQLLGAEHVLVGRTSSNLGIIEADRGHYEEALLYQRRAVAVMRGALGAEHRDTLAARVNLALAQARLGRHDEALAEVEAVIAAQTRLGLGGSYEAAFAQTTLGTLLVDAGRPEAAAVALERALALSQRLFGAEHPELAGVYEGLGRAALLRGERDVAVARLERSLALRERASGGDHVALAWPLVHLVAAHLERDDVVLALAAAARASALVAAATVDPRLRGQVQLAHARALVAAQRQEEAAAAARAAVLQFEALGAPAAAERAEAEALLATLGARSGE